MERKITDLFDDAVSYQDYDKRINFLLAGLLSAESNDTPEKEKANMEYLKEIYSYCWAYTGDKKEYITHIAEKIKEYLE